MFDPQELAKTLGNLQEKLKEAQEESKNLTFSAKSGGGVSSYHSKWRGRSH